MLSTHSFALLPVGGEESKDFAETERIIICRLSREEIKLSIAHDIQVQIPKFKEASNTRNTEIKANLVVLLLPTLAHQTILLTRN